MSGIAAAPMRNGLYLCLMLVKSSAIPTTPAPAMVATPATRGDIGEPVASMMTTEQVRNAKRTERPPISAVTGLPGLWMSFPVIPILTNFVERYLADT